MAARSRRAVRVDPGAAADRRASAGEKESRRDDPPLHPVRFGEDRESVRGRSAVPLEPLIHPRRGHISTGERAVRDSGLEVFDPFLFLYRLEQHRGAFEVLIRLYRHGPAGKYRMRCELKPGQRALSATLRNLEGIGLIASTRERAFPYTQIYHLTTLGRQLLEIPLASWAPLLEV